MPAYPRVSGGDPHAAGRGRQRLKLAAIGYFNARHGVDADADLARAGRTLLRQTAGEFVDALTGSQWMKNRRVDVAQGDDEMLCLAAIAYVGARHGIDADVGMSREGLALLCQAAIEFVESLPREEVPKRSSPHLQIGGGA